MRAPFLKKHLSPNQWELLNDKIMRYTLAKFGRMAAVKTTSPYITKNLTPALDQLAVGLKVEDEKLSSAYYKGKFPVDLPKTRLFNICMFFLWMRHHQNYRFLPDSDISLLCWSNAAKLDRVMKKCRIYSCGNYGPEALKTIYNELFS